MGNIKSRREVILDEDLVEAWDRESVRDWLRNNNFGTYSEIFYNKRIDGKKLLQLSEEDLSKLQVAKTDIEKLMNLGNKLRSNYLNSNLTDVEKKRVDNAVKKLEKLRGLSSLSEEKKKNRARDLVAKNCMLESYLSKDLVATRKTMVELIEQDESENTSSRFGGMSSVSRANFSSVATDLTPRSTAENSTNDSNNNDDNNNDDKITLEEQQKEIETLKAMKQDYEAVARFGENRSKGKVVTDEEFLKVKFVVVEIHQTASQRSMRRLLSPIMDQFDMAPQFGMFHTAIIIGPWYLEWNDSSLVVPRKCYSGAALLAADVSKDFRGAQVQNALDKMAEVICNWNATYEYSRNKRNCQTFVDELCHALGISLQFTGALQHFIDQCRSLGVCDLKFPISEELKNILKTTEEYKFFKSHKELDAFVKQVEEASPIYFQNHPDDKLLLKSYDRAFWLRYFKNKWDDNFKPEEVNDSNYATSCPFGHPYQTLSMVNTSM